MTVFTRLLPLLVALVLSGCLARSVPVASPPTATKASASGLAVAPVDTARIELDATLRTVKLYPVDNGGHWLVILPGKPQERIAGLEFRVPEGVKLDEVEVYHVIPDLGPSNAVKLAQVKKKE